MRKKYITLAFNTTLQGETGREVSTGTAHGIIYIYQLKGSIRSCRSSWDSVSLNYHVSDKL